MQEILVMETPFFVSDKKKLEERIGKFFGKKCQIINVEKFGKGWCITLIRKKLLGQSEEVKILLYEQKMKEGGNLKRITGVGLLGE